MIPEDIVPLVTERLILRLVEESDAAAIHRFRSDPSVTRYLSHGPLTVAANGERLAELLALRKASTAEWFNYGWAVTLRESGDVIGDARTWNSIELTSAGMLSQGKLPARHSALGYVLHPDYHRQGYGREAAGALVGWLFSERRMNTIVAGAYEPNTPSIKLLQSLGFQQDTAAPADRETAGKGYPLLNFRLDNPQQSIA